MNAQQSDAKRLDRTFEETVVAVHGDLGAAWLERLTQTVRECADAWSLEVGPKFEAGRHSFVAPGTRADGTDVVLKLAVQAGPDYHAEREALEAFAGVGCARLLAYDVDRAALLLERVLPGRPISELVEGGRDDLATLPALTVMARLWRRVPDRTRMPNVSDEATAAFAWLRSSHGGGTGPLRSERVEQAENLVEKLNSTAPDPVVLHGDLHYDNILTSDRQGWLAIDPKGRIGEPACEVAALLRTPLPFLVAHPDRYALLAERVQQFSMFLALNPSRVIAWGIALAVAAACWELEDHGAGWEPWLIIADTLAAMEQ